MRGSASPHSRPTGVSNWDGHVQSRLLSASVVAVAGDDRSIYVEIAAELRQRIQCGEIKRGHPAPSVTSLCQEFDTKPETVAHAMRLLEEEGLVRSDPARAYYIIAP